MMADGNTKSKDTKDAQERHAVDFEKDAAEDSNPLVSSGDAMVCDINANRWLR